MASKYAYSPLNHESSRSFLLNRFFHILLILALTAFVFYLGRASASSAWSPIKLSDSTKADSTCAPPPSTSTTNPSSAPSTPSTSPSTPHLPNPNEFAPSGPNSTEAILDLKLSAPEPISYNRTFGLPPSPESNNAWTSLFPIQGGFFKHPVLAPQRSAFAVFHQLHCLDGLRMAVWMGHGEEDESLFPAAPSKAHEGHEEHGKHERGEEKDSKPSMDEKEAAKGHDHADHVAMMTDPAHLRHCIDLLRQALMCRPDLAIEVKDELGGVKGFGTDHQCIDWGQLLGWMGDWEGWREGKPLPGS